MRDALLGFGIVLGVQFAVPSFVISADAANLETIRARGYLIVAVKDNRRPLGFLDENGQLVGYEIDIARQLADALLGDAEAVELRPVANDDRLAAVLSGEVDVAIAGLAVTPARERIVSFSVPYYLDGTGLITRLPTIRTVQDLTRRTIAVLSASDAVPAVGYLLPQANLLGVESYHAAHESLERDRADAFAGDITILTGWQQADPSYRLLPEVLTVAPLAIALPKGNQHAELRRAINAALVTWHNDGWLEERATAWGLP